MSGWVSVIKTPIQQKIDAAGRGLGRVGLLPAIVSALVAGAIVAGLAYGLLRVIVPVDTALRAAEIDLTRVALTVVASVGGVVALVIAYRRQRDVEQSRFVERFGAAAAQLGATDVAVRIAGVYAMAGVADESAGSRRQQCIDVLCGYLRLPYDTEQGASGRTKLVITAPRIDRGRVRGETEEHLEYRQNDREVRATIVRVIADHLRPSAEYSWSVNTFDFRTAHLENADFEGATFAGTVRFDRATFSGNAWFKKVTFSRTARFRRVTFLDAARFDEAIFADTARFEGVTFTGDARFQEATFRGEAWFDGATFTADAGFDKATFTGTARFGEGGFPGADLPGKVTFADEASFHGATFTADANFNTATFAGTAYFAEATFAGDAQFTDAAFGGATRFVGATFTGNALFAGAVFSDTV